MTLPTFLGIGVPRSGTTWLHELLKTHPQVYVPKYRKEIHFFNKNYDRGIDWYEKYFPSDARADKYRAIGEITPFYLFYDACIERILKMPSIKKLIINLRNPVDRAYSYYVVMIQNGECVGSFEECMSQHPDILQQSFYSEQLKKYFHHFDREQMLFLIYEQTIASSISKTKEIVANFLDIDVEGFPSTAGVGKVAVSRIPKAHAAYLFFNKIAWMLKDRRLDCIVSWSIKLGIKRVFGKQPLPPKMKEETRRYLKKLYQSEIYELESLLNINLDCWK
ncbi:sulfotransferase domain-containing protein [Candidatus Poribacteria bacterium]|nr:sulfotransferase domain-containing protein [Candidatus Poribacteria bacterium]